jgi:hypothetical protein
MRQRTYSRPRTTLKGRERLLRLRLLGMSSTKLQLPNMMHTRLGTLKLKSLRNSKVSELLKKVFKEKSALLKLTKTVLKR